MKVVINPEFSVLKEFIYNIPQNFDKGGKTIYKARNEIKVFEVNGIEVNVKKYCIPHFLNRFVYAYIRKSKAERAYKHALQLLKKGIVTPTPIAYILQKKYGLLNNSYFVSLQSPLSRRFNEFAENPNDIYCKEHIVEAVAKYIAKMHENNILHLDLSIGNILFEDTAKEVLFSIVDLNRMRFKKINQELGCKNFQRLRGSDEFFRILGKSYAKARAFDEEKCVSDILRYNAKHIESFKRRKKIKQKLGLSK
ncbi:MAG: lipopolysaccharide kinase InaA family protein [Bacteroidales bacterium]|jgi:tRNA A-37 threonylcarbamoyl transferase component Bud32|nr:lipopolysaccharide kinase InaA family protein [Bacteroidales bacterium]